MAARPGQLIYADAEERRGEESFEALYRCYFPRLVRFCRKRLGDQATAEDLAQEALCRVMTRFDSLDLATPIWPWLKTVACNLITDRARAVHRERQLALEAAPDPDPSSYIEERAVVAEALDHLNARQQVALRLRYLDDWSRSEVARFMGLSPLAVDQLLFRARSRLRDEYGRLSRGAGAVVFGLRFAFRRHIERFQSSPSMPALSQLASSGGLQLTAAVLVMAGSAVTPMPGLESPTRTDLSALPASAGAMRPAPALFGASAASSPASVLASGATEASSGPTSNESTAKEPKEIVVGVVHPTKNVTQPEDSTIASFAHRPSPDGPGDLYAVGEAPCSTPHCPPVLFRSSDGGHEWRRLRANGLQGDSLLVPQDGGAADGLLFAMGRNGLQVSEDGGRTFGPSTTVPAAAAGSAAISPTFSTADPSILIGAQTLMRYRHDTRVTQPALNGGVGGRLEPAFSPNYVEDGLTYLGGVSPDSRTGKMASAVWTCDAVRCESRSIAQLTGAPKLRFAPRAQSRDVLLFTADSLLRAPSPEDMEFEYVGIPLGGAWIRDVEFAGPRVVVSTHSSDERKAGGVLISSDGGRQWTRVSSRLFDGGAGDLFSVGGRILAARIGNGLACSIDGGRTWKARC